MGSRRKSKLQYAPGVNYTCTGCGLCCSKGWCISLSNENLQEFQKINWAEKYPYLEGAELFVPIGNQYRFGMDDNGRCLFLDSENKCLIHREIGFAEKALTCRFYPLTMTATDNGVRVGAHFSCPAVAEGGGVPLSDRKEKIELLYRDYAESHFNSYVPSDGPVWSGNTIIAWDRLGILENHMRIILDDAGKPLLRRVIEISCLLDYLEGYSLCDMDAAEFESVFSHLCEKAVDYANNLGLKKYNLNIFERLFCRLFVGLSCEMMVPGLLSRHFTKRFTARLKRFLLCMRFFFGCGEFSIDGNKGKFTDIAKVRAYPLQPDQEEVIAEYLKMRLFCRTYYGNESWGLDVLHGARFLFSLYPVTIYLSRMNTLAGDGSCADNEYAVSKDDIKRSVMLVDNTFGHLANLSLGAGTRLLSYLCSSKWVEKSALFAVFS
ncbi:MAG: YkgJ family cysteine cluster protein [Planctomycetota bacterium]